MPKAEDKKT